MAVLHKSELKSTKGKAVYAVIVLILLFAMPVQLFPLLYSFSNSLKTGIEISNPIPTLLPKTADWSVYAKIFTQYDFGQNMINSIVLCVSIIAFQVTVSALAAYVISIMKPPGSRLILLMFVGTLMISAPAIMFPLYIMMAQMNLLDSYWSIILPCTAWGYSIMLFKGFFDGIPGDIISSAEIDGAGFLCMFYKIVLPLSKPVVIVNVVNTFMSVYNDVGMHSMFLQSKAKWPIMVRMYSIIQGSSMQENLTFAMGIVSTVPILIVYLFCQKYIVQGITMSGIKS